MFKYILIVASGAVMVILATNVERCPGSVPKPDKVQISGCAKAPCTLRRGRTVDVNVTFTSRVDNLDNLKGRLHVYFLLVDRPIPISADQANVCNHLVNATCPLQRDQQVTYRSSFKIPTNSPRSSGTLEAKIVTDRNRGVVCFRVRGKIV